MEHYGLISIIPPLLVVILAIRTKNVIFSLFIGLFFGTTVLANWNPLAGFISIIEKYVYVEIAKTWNAQALVNMLIIGAFVALISASGGSLAFVKLVSKKINTKVKTELAMWIAGISIWFSDSANSLLIGPIFQPLADKLKVSREKYAFILDATSAPICALIPIISWGVYIMGLIENELEAMSITNMTPWEIFVNAVPFQFYSWLTLGMVGYLAITQFDFGPMLKAQKRAENGKILRDGAIPLRNEQEIEIPEGKEPKAITMVLPLVVLFIVMFSIFVMNGFPAQKMSGTAIRLGIATGFISGAIVCAVLSVNYGFMTYKSAQGKMFDGMKDMVYMLLLLVFAWSLGSACKELGTAKFIVSIVDEFMNPAFLPAIIFILGAVISFSTGTSYGTFAILMPIAIPVSIAMDISVYVSVAAVISSGLFGDHCSPVSDTTILASMGAACDHIDHFRTQVPYALTVGIVATILFVIAGFTNNKIIIIPGAIALAIIIYLLHKISLKKYEEKNIADEVNF